MPTKPQLMVIAAAVSAFLVGALLVPTRASAPERPLRIGFPPWIAYDIMLHADRAGMFEKHGLEVELIRFDETSDVARAVMSGGLDAGFTGLATLVANHDGTPVEVVFFTNISDGADGIVARPGIDTVGELRGKRIGCKVRATNRLVLAEALAHHGLSIDEVEIVDVSNTAAELMLVDGSIDAAVIWEPDLTEVATRTGGRVIHRTSDLDSLVLDTLTASASIASERRDELTALRTVWFELLDTIEQDPAPVFETVADALRQDPALPEEAWSGVLPADERVNLLLVQSFEENLSSVAHFMECAIPAEIRPGPIGDPLHASPEHAP